MYYTYNIKLLAMSVFTNLGMRNNQIMVLNTKYFMYCFPEFEHGETIDYMH